MPFAARLLALVRSRPSPLHPSRWLTGELSRMSCCFHPAHVCHSVASPALLSRRTGLGTLWVAVGVRANAGDRDAPFRPTPPLANRNLARVRALESAIPDSIYCTSSLI